MEIITDDYTYKYIYPQSAIVELEVSFKDNHLKLSYLLKGGGQNNFEFQAKPYKQVLREMREAFNERLSAIEFLKLFKNHRDCNQINVDGILNRDKDIFIWGEFASETRLLLGHFFNQINNNSKREEAGFLNRKIDLLIPDWELDFKNYIGEENL